MTPLVSSEISKTVVGATAGTDAALDTTDGAKAFTVDGEDVNGGPVKVGVSVPEGLRFAGSDPKKAGACDGAVSNVGKGVELAGEDGLFTAGAVEAGFDAVAGFCEADGVCALPLIVGLFPEVELGLFPEEELGLLPVEELGLLPEEEVGLIGLLGCGGFCEGTVGDDSVPS